MDKTLRFIIIPKVAHPWFDDVNQGAQAEAATLRREYGVAITVDYMPPRVCHVDAQNAILDQILQIKPHGIAVDPVDAVGPMIEIYRIKNQGIPVVLFDSPSPDPEITSIGNDFTQQGEIAAERLARLIGYKGQVAIMQGYPSAPNHKARYLAQLAVLGKYPEITVVNGGIDNDDIPTAERQALAVLKSHPDLKGYLCCDAAGPIGIATAIQREGRVGKVKVVSMDGIRPILEAIKAGVIEASSATIPKMQGALAVLMLWQAAMGLPLPQKVDTGIDVITAENVDLFLAQS